MRNIIYVSIGLLMSENNIWKTKLLYKPDSKKVGTLYKLWIKKECNNLQIS